ncbi:MAG: PBP1A family penicillin-binding protein [Spirochaetales bacterium]|nr:PBP1A family penicillin-binding protein [Spirochaetales bacterium]
MLLTGKRRTIVLLFAGSLIITAAALGAALGWSLAVNRNTQNMDELIANRPAIPSRVLDINGDLITEFFSDEKRDLIPITSLPEVQIQALLTREDAPFFEHTGISIVGLLRATFRSAIYAITKQGSLQGASTLTMQLAGRRHADRSDISVSRKLREIWWAYQLERRFTKQEILEQYLNSVYFGHNTYGVEAASQFFMGHSATENSAAESVMLAIQLAGSGLYSPIIKPDVARARQREILNQMVDAGYITMNEADSSFDEYWNNYDWSRSPTDSPYFDRLANDKAPYFSEYIRSEVEQYLFGQQDIYRDGFTIHTTLNLEYQKAANDQIQAGLPVWNAKYRNERSEKDNYALENLIDTVDMLSLAFDIPGIRVADALQTRRAKAYMQNDLNPVMDMMSLAFGLQPLKSLANISYNEAKSTVKKNNVETALITLDNETGYILAMVGGSEFNRNNQFNRAMNANVMPGSAFKPLYYSAGISSGMFTPSSRILDGPREFISPDGTPYTPTNYNGRWNGYVLLRNALARSLNIPALVVLETIGFDAAIERSASLLGITDPQDVAKTFERVYPLALGIISVPPIRLARAYATLANRGRAVEPFAIRYIEDRDGNVIVNPERELRASQEKRDMQVLSPQAAYVMTDMLQSTVQYGTLRYARVRVDGFDGMPMAGKTGTTQNWTDAWTVGYSPYVTTVMWIGFDQRGNSLGKGQTGATSTGPYWAQYMKNIHANLARIPFPEPETGIVRVDIDRHTGMLPEADTPENQIREEVFIAGTQPRSIGTLASFEKQRNEEQAIRIAVDSTLSSPAFQAADNASYTSELFAELGLDEKYLGNDVTNDPFGLIPSTPTPTRKPVQPAAPSGILD